MYFWSVSLVYQLFGQFLIFLVDQKNFGIAKKNLGIPKRNLVDRKKKIWSTKKIFSIPKKDLVYQKNEKLTNNWYTKETDQKYMDAAHTS